ncbi:hypothetical protein CsSME_00002585 [Camellia sinensis var. sinensis]
METKPEKYGYNKDSLVGDSEKKAFAITWDDESESDKDKSDNEAQGEEGHEQFLTFMAASETEGQIEYPKRSVEAEKATMHVGKWSERT